MRIEKKIILLEFSFLLHEEYLVDKQNIPKNKEYTDNFIISGLCSPSIWNNDKRNTKIPSNEFIVINNKEKKNFNYLHNYEEQTVLFESPKGLNMVDKWVFFIHSLFNKTNNIAFDLLSIDDTRAFLWFF